MSGLICIAALLEVSRKKTFFKTFYGFEPAQNQNQVKYSHNKCYDKRVLIERTLKLTKETKSKE